MEGRVMEPAVLALAGWHRVPGHLRRRDGKHHRRSRLQYRDDGLSGNPYRPVLLPADRHADLSAYRQHRHQPKTRRASAVCAGRTRDPRPAAAARAAGAPKPSLPEFLRRGRVVAIADIDTRKLTRILREKGAHVRLHHDRRHVDAKTAVAMRARVSRAGGHGPGEGRQRQGRLPVERRRHLAHAAGRRSGPSAAAVMSWPTTSASSATSCGCWSDHGCRMTVVPAQTPAEQVLALRARWRLPVQRAGRSGAVHLCDRGDPRDPGRRTSRCSASASGTSCWASRAARSTIKMKFGHHGANHPVQDLATRPRVDHQPEPWLCRGRGHAAGQPAGDAPVAVRRFAAGHRAN